MERTDASTELPAVCDAIPEPTPDSLFRDHYFRLSRTAMLLTDDSRLAEDIVQDAFAELVTRWNRIDANRAAAYLYRSVVNGGRSMLRRRRTVRTAVQDRPQAEPAADEAVLRQARDDRIRAAVAQLPRRQRQVVTMRFYSDLSVGEVSEVLQISLSAVAMATHHAMRTLQQSLKELS